MNFGDAVKEVALEIKLDDATVRNRYKRYLNEAIEDFMDLRDWTYLRFPLIVTIDDSNVYDLQALTAGTNPIYKFLQVVQEGGDNSSGQQGPVNAAISQLSPSYTKIPYPTYIRAKEKSNVYAIEKRNFYVTGTGFDLNLFYMSSGIGYPMVADSDEPAVMTEYPEIIVQWAVVKFLKYFGEQDTAQIEESELNRMLTRKKRKEAEENKNGAMVRIASHNRGA